MKKLVFFALILGLVSCDPQTLNSVLSTLPTSASTPALSTQEVIEGLKEALKVGTTNAVVVGAACAGVVAAAKRLGVGVSRLRLR